MKGYVLISALMVMFVSATVLAQEFDEGRDWPQEDEDMKHQMHDRHMELEMEEQEAELDFQRKMQELELEKRRIDIENERTVREHPRPFWQHHKPGLLPFPVKVLLIVVHILLTVWVYKDIRARGAGSGIWIVVVLLTGILGGLLYAIVRLGDIRQTKS